MKVIINPGLKIIVKLQIKFKYLIKIAFIFA